MKIKDIIVFLALAIIGVVFLVSARNIADGTNNYAINSFSPVKSANNDYANNNEVAATIENGAQNVKLSLVNYQYQLSPSTLKKGVPVRMEVDLKSVTGCMTAVRIPAFGVSKTVRSGDNIITFTPDKAGTFQIACSMGMGRNTFNVVDETGNAGTYVEPAQATGGSCGAGGGGCGCGGGV